MACTPSARFEEEFPDETSEFAEEGDAAHQIADMLIQCELNGNDVDDLMKVQEFCAENKYFNKEMHDAVEEYVEFVLGKFYEYRKHDPSAILMPEQKLDYSVYVPGGFGTGDATIICNGVLEIIDLKYGKGVPVFAEGNPQLKLYGLAAWNTFKSIYDIDFIRMTIMQPRLNSTTTDTISVPDLLKWTKEEVTPKANLAWMGRGDLVSGDHCQFCRAVPRCPRLAQDNMEMAKYDFQLPKKLSDDEVSDVLRKVDKLTKWAKGVQDYALKQAINHGQFWPGFKLVEGRSNRIITDQQKAKEILMNQGIDEALMYKPRQMVALGELERLVGKKKFNEIMASIIEKPPGKPTLVQDSDIRPEFNSAAAAARDFKEE